MLKTLIGLSLIKGFSVPRVASKSKQTANSILEILFILSEIVVFFTNLTYIVIAKIFKLISRCVKYIYRKFCTGDTVSDVKHSNIVSFEEYKNKKKAS